MDEHRRLTAAIGVSEWETYIEHAHALGEPGLVEALRREQLMMLLAELGNDGFLFYPGHESLSEGPALARRYCTEHLPGTAWTVSNPE